MKHLLLTIVCAGAAFLPTAGAFAQGSRGVDCSLPGLTFACPQGLRVIAAADAKSFLALGKETDDQFAIFVVDKAAAPDISAIIEKKFLPALWPKANRTFEWKPLELMNPRPVSRFEVDRRIASGFNGAMLVRYVSREIHVGERSFYAGSIWHEDESVADARALFPMIRGVYEGSGCSHMLKMVRSITGEGAVSAENDPCTIEMNTVPSAESK